MNTTMILILLPCLLISIIFWIFLNKLSLISNNKEELLELQQENQNLKIEIAKLRNAEEYLKKEFIRVQNELNLTFSQLETIKQDNLSLLALNQELSNTKSRLEVENQNLSDAYAKLDKTITEVRQQMNYEFSQLKTLAISELEQKANQSLKDIGRDNIIIPLQEHFKDLQNKINDLSLETKLINRNSTELNEQAKNLALALTKDSKKKGDFGELILANLLESVGLQEHISYIEQPQIKTIDKKLIPDVIINLPHHRSVVIDSKNIMQRYYESVVNQEDKRKAIVDAIKNTFKNLSDKDYINAVESSTSRQVFDYVIMFIPNEGLFNFIIEEDQSLNGAILRDAYQQKVFIAGPSTLLVLLGMIERTWETYQVEERAELIINLAKEISDKIKLSLTRIADLGILIKKSATQYNDVIKALDNGTASSMVGKLDKLVYLSGNKHDQIKLNGINEALRSPASLQ